MDSQHFSIQPLDDNDIQLDHPLGKLQETVGEAIEIYSEKLAMMEAEVAQQRKVDLLFKLSKILLDPYLIILFVYLSIVLVQLILLTRSALQGRFRNVYYKPNRIKVLLFLSGISLSATWYK